jgi:hypothetical protein
VSKVLDFCKTLDDTEEVKVAGINVIFSLSTYSPGIILGLFKLENHALEVISEYLTTN